MFLTSDGWLKYEGVDGEYEVNNPRKRTKYQKSIAATCGEWHYMAIIVRNDGYG